MRRVFFAAMLCALATAALPGQDADFGVSVPVTLSGGTLYSKRLQLEDPNASPAAAAFRAMLYPTVKLGKNWFGYAAVQIRSTPYFYYDAFDPDREVYANVLQGFVGYSWRKDKVAMMFKAGKLTSAFGSFPLHYDDAENPLLDQPLSYNTDLPLSVHEAVGGTADVLSDHYGYGEVPVTLYGLPGVQAEISAGRFDGRFQLTTGSPANPKGLETGFQYVQWAAGGGYTVHQGFRVGVSGFRGPYLDREAVVRPRDFPASGIGADVQWERGRWSASGELQRFKFDSPNFVDAPGITAGYVQVKSVITPRLYLAARGGFFYAGHVLDSSGVSADQFAPYLQQYELGAGVWVSRNQLLKGSYEWMTTEGRSGTRNNVVGFEYVVQVRSLAWAFR